MSTSNRRISDVLGLPERDSLRHYQMVTQDRPWWPVEWRYLWFVFREIVWQGDSSQIRFLMGGASLGWGVLCLRPGVFANPNYILMQFFPAWAWSLAFFVHGFGAWWRIFERRSRVKTAYAINLWGCVIWFAATSAINWAAGHPVIGSTLEWCALSMLICATINTGRTEERGTA